ncbi:MAG TPA: AbiEi antitoxin N-terminal domain-containing protein [Chitinophagaceae bacterium]|jgi:Transcriptional regulator, AbiEi antitoxin N-terminal domain|nr:AbiEi antitoxin N-terminal domain-containing protein [Chitinophagaceae bacterium]
MTTVNRTKINQLLQEQPLGVVLLSSWLAKQGYSIDLQKHYRKTKWLQSIGKGAHIRADDKVGYEGAVYALQKQSELTIHPGGRTALSLLGKAHYLKLGSGKVVLFLW